MCRALSAVHRAGLVHRDAALARPKNEDREAIIGRVELGMTYQELAEALGKPSAEAARTSAERALVRLVQAMEEADKPLDPC